MDPIAIIKEDHRRFEELFAKYDTLGEEEYGRKKELAETIMDELEAHTEMEETTAYPVFRAAFDPETEKRVEEAYAEHDLAKTLIEELRGLEAEDPQFDAKMTVLRESVTHHVEEEEEDLLPLAEEKVGGDEMARIGQEMQAFRDAREDAALDSLTDEDESF